MKLKDYILRWQEVYDKNQSRPTTYGSPPFIRMISASAE